MRAVVQRVRYTRVTAGGEVLAAIGGGLLVLVGVTHTDTPAEARKLAAKLAKLRIFSDEAGKMNLSVGDVGGSALVVSQFTLYADLGSGNRPSFTAAADPSLAGPLIDAVVENLRDQGVTTETGRFGAHMEVELANDGPVTIVIDT